MVTSTVTSGFTRAILQTLQGLNIQLPQAVVDEVASELSQKRLSISLQNMMWQSIEEQSASPYVGLSIGTAMRLVNYDLVGLLVQSSESLANAAESLTSYFALIGEGGEFYTTTVADSRRLNYRLNFDIARRIRIETVIAGVASGSHWLTGGQIKPLMIGFEHDEPDNLAEYKKAFGDVEICFKQQDNFVAYSLKDWHDPLPCVGQDVQIQMQELARKQLREMHPDNVLAKVLALLNEAPELSRQEVAEKLAVSERHLNRKLAEFGCHFWKLSDQVRKDKALDMLIQKNLSQAYVAQALGYADENAFSKAFRRWMGMGLREYRTGLGEK